MWPTIKSQRRPGAHTQARCSSRAADPQIAKAGGDASGESNSKDVRYLDIHEDDQLDDGLLTSWIRQAAELPGWIP